MIRQCISVVWTGGRWQKRNRVVAEKGVWIKGMFLRMGEKMAYLKANGKEPGEGERERETDLNWTYANVLVGWHSGIFSLLRIAFAWLVLHLCGQAESDVTACDTFFSFHVL